MNPSELRERIQENDLLVDELRAWVLDFRTEGVEADAIAAAFAADAVAIADEAIALTAAERERSVE